MTVPERRKLTKISVFLTPIVTSIQDVPETETIIAHISKTPKGISVISVN